MELFENPRHILMILPVLAILIAIEAVLYPRFKGHSYPWRDSGVSLLIAVGHGVMGFVNRAVVYGIFALVVWKHRIATIPMDNGWSIGAVIILEEFAYYWYHRAAHRVRLMWGTHSVHHSAEELTLFASYRLSWTPILSLSYLFFLPLVWIGFPPVWVFGMLAASLLYQFWLHSTLIPRLGPLEWVLNTPSAHRVHHASNEQYLDRNYGGIVIVFDRLFGTYAAEDDRIPIRYGLVHPVRSLNPFVIVYTEFWHILKDAWAARSWGDRWRVLLKPPGWRPAT